jgi:hypothetical protein
MQTLRSTLPSCAALAGLLLVVPRCSNVAGTTPGTGMGACSTNPAGDDDDGGDDGDDDDSGASSCKPGDADGIIGGCYAFALSVDDTAFSSIILKTQNLGNVTLTLANNGTRPHDFVVDCLPTPNVQGCPPQSCFPAAANIAPLAPGAHVSTTFVTPNPEGIYNFRSDVAGDSTVESDGGVSGLWGQFILQ